MSIFIGTSTSVDDGIKYISYDIHLKRGQTEYVIDIKSSSLKLYDDHIQLGNNITITKSYIQYKTDEYVYVYGKHYTDYESCTIKTKIKSEQYEKIRVLLEKK